MQRQGAGRYVATGSLRRRSSGGGRVYKPKIRKQVRSSNYRDIDWMNVGIGVLVVVFLLVIVWALGLAYEAGYQTALQSVTK